MKEFFKWFIYSRSDSAMVVRTLFEAIVSWIAANLPEIMNLFDISEGVKGLIISFVMVFVSWMLGVVRSAKDENVLN